MRREIARLNSRGELQAVAELEHTKCGDQGDPGQMVRFGTWNAVVKYGSARFGPAITAWNDAPEGRALVAQLGENQFLVAG